MDVVVATSNRGKLREIQAILADLPVTWLSLEAVPGLRLPEEGGEYAANARAKARAVAQQAGCPALADDSGLEVEGLGWAPGPDSARYGGPGLDDAGRVAHLLEQMREFEGDARRARFVCVAVLSTPEGVVRERRGECRGRIRESAVGAGGFGYDPIFEVEGACHAGRSMAELGEAEKNRISHRARAFRALASELSALGAGASR